MLSTKYNASFTLNNKNKDSGLIDKSGLAFNLKEQLSSRQSMPKMENIQKMSNTNTKSRNGKEVLIGNPMFHSDLTPLINNFSSQQKMIMTHFKKDNNGEKINSITNALNKSNNNFNNKKNVSTSSRLNIKGKNSYII
jgi:hypothetical protein